MDKNVRDQVVERLKTANNVLVTVSRNPSVDQLAACIGMTLLLNKLGKHATAVFSGSVPSTIEFLNPGKTLEKNTDSLRDFIIALDKAKADKLRYKVEDEVVKIFITPYKTSISQKDLEFSQGDFNVDVVLALGVHAKEELDQTIIAHGRILHDAEVISVNNSDNGDLGTTNWVDTKASSLSEMLVGVGQLLDRNGLDNQMATAFLTGIVAETNRFSNAKVTSETMSTSSILMNAGASTQLVASKLEPPKAVTPQPIPKHPDSKEDLEPKEEEPAKPDGELSIEHDASAELTKKEEPIPNPEPDAALDFGMHDEKKPDLEEIKIDGDGQIVLDEPVVEVKPVEPVAETTPEPAVEEKPVEEAPVEPQPETPPEPEPMEPQIVTPTPEPEPAKEPEVPAEAIESAHKVIDEPPAIVPSSDARQEVEEEVPKIEPDSGLPTDLPTPTPMLKHDTSSSSSTTTSEPMPPISKHKIDAPSEAVTPEPTTPADDVPSLGSEPDDTTIDDEKTLENIEESINSTHLTHEPAMQVTPAVAPSPEPVKPVEPVVAPPPTVDEAQSSIDSARAAVSQAINSAAGDNLEPIVAIGAQPLSSEEPVGQGSVTPLTPTPTTLPGEATMPGPTFVEPTVGLPSNLVPPQPNPLTAPQDSAPPTGPPPMMPPPIYPS